MEGVAVLSSVTRETGTQTSVVVALTTATTFERVVVGRLGLGDTTDGVSSFITGLDGKTSDLGGASITALVGVNNQKVLVTLNGITGEGNINGVFRGSSGDLGHSDGAAVDHSVGQVQKGQLDIIGEVTRVGGGDIVKDNGDSGVCFTQLSLE